LSGNAGADVWRPVDSRLLKIKWVSGFVKRGGSDSLCDPYGGIRFLGTAFLDGEPRCNEETISPVKESGRKAEVLCDR